MSEPDLICEVRSAGGVYRDWLSVAVSYSYGDGSWKRRFRLQCAEPDLRRFRLAPSDEVDITLAGEPVIVRGVITDRQAAFDANRHAVQVDGTSKAALAEMTSIDVPGGQFRGYKLQAIGDTILKKSGVKFRIENGGAAADLPFSNVAVHHGESPFAMLMRLCRMRGLWMRTDADGTIVAGTKVADGGTTLEQGRNILTASCHISIPWIEEIVLRAQQPGSDQVSGRKASEVSAKATMKGGVGATGIYLAEMSADTEGLKHRVQMQAQMIQSALLRVTVTHHGWLKPGEGRLWELTDRVTVRSPMLFPAGTDKLDLRVWGVTYAQDANVGTTTSVELVTDATFQRVKPDAMTPSPFGRETTEPQPEVST